MAKEKFFKCAFSHCAHEGKQIPADEAVKINSRYWHKDCYRTSQLVEEIVEDYMNCVSQTVVISMLRSIINNIVYGKKLENPKIPKSESNLNAAEYLNFAFQFAMNHDIRLTHPQGLYYLIDNSKVKEAWQKKQDAKYQREAKENVDTSESNQTTFTMNPNNRSGGFGDIFGGL